MEGAVLPRRDDAAVVILSCQNLCLETDPCQRGHRQLCFGETPSELGIRWAPKCASDRRFIFVIQLYRNISRIPLHLAALHDLAHTIGPRACAQ